MDVVAPVLDWLAASLDPTRPHAITIAQAWHGRLMVLAWGMVVPLGVIIARYLKVTPWQNWPQELDNRFWWHTHLVLQNGALALALIALAVVLVDLNGPHVRHFHGVVGWLLVALAGMQFASGVLRGTKGGPTSPAPDGSLHGDHYSMTRRRRLFERFHKTAGYVLLCAGAAAVLSGLWLVNAPRWMAVAIVSYWVAIAVLVVALRRTVPQVTTYEAIWGPDPSLPGNQPDNAWERG